MSRLLWCFLLFALLVTMVDKTEGWRRRRRRRCFVNCAVGYWSSWSSCNQPCGTRGTQTRTRGITRPARCGGSCRYTFRQTRSCNTRCPNGGTPAPGRCICKTGYSGRCCTGGKHHLQTLLTVRITTGLECLVHPLTLGCLERECFLHLFVRSLVLPK